MDNGLLHRADCHASGAADKAAVIVKGDIGPLNLCAHCLRAHGPTLEERGWIVEVLRDPAIDDCDSEVAAR